jgi:ferritin-like metal-binding protein YciE
MANDLPGLYFRKLRMLYCSELQLISFYSEVAAHAADGGVEALTDDCRERRNLLENIASQHGISIAGDDCQSMRRLIAASRVDLAADHETCGDLANGVCESVHRLQILNYSVARSLAAKAGLKEDTKILDHLLDTMLGRFPQASESVVPLGMVREAELVAR